MKQPRWGDAQRRGRTRTRLATRRELGPFPSTYYHKLVITTLLTLSYYIMVYYIIAFPARQAATEDGIPWEEQGIVEVAPPECCGCGSCSCYRSCLCSGCCQLRCCSYCYCCYSLPMEGGSFETEQICRTVCRPCGLCLTATAIAAGTEVDTVTASSATATLAIPAHHCCRCCYCIVGHAQLATARTRGTHHRYTCLLE